MIFKCPGQDNRSISAEIISCPDCGKKLEIFSDEIQVKCPECKRTVTRERPPSCLDWCKSASECAGEEFYGNYIENKHRFLKDKLLKELEEYLKNYRAMRGILLMLLFLSRETATRFLKFFFQGKANLLKRFLINFRQLIKRPETIAVYFFLPSK